MYTTAECDAKVCEALLAAGVRFSVLGPGSIVVDRTSMCQTFPFSGDEHASYKRTLEFVKSAVGMDAYYVCWGVRTDDYLGIDVYVRPSV